MGGYTLGVNSTVASTGPVVYGYNTGFVNTRQRVIQGLQGNFPAASVGEDLKSFVVPSNDETTIPSGVVIPAGASYSVRRYMISLALGLFCQDKLLPTQWMASQLTLEFYMEQANACIYQPIGAAANSRQPTYAIGNVELVIEQVTFDDQYDKDFLDALESKGVPIKFSTWDWFSFGTQGSSSNQYQITERCRSIKGMFVCQRRYPTDFAYDSHAAFFDTNTTVGVVADTTGSGSTLQQAQWRVGGRYIPGAPTQYSCNIGGKVSNGGAEGILDLQKFLNTVGNYSLQTNVNAKNFAVPSNIRRSTDPSIPPVYNEFDYRDSLVTWDSNGIPVTVTVEAPTLGNVIAGNATITTPDTTGNMPSGCFACAINFETSNGIEIAGLNGEEQTDISFNVRWSGSQNKNFNIEAFILVDKMWVLKPNNYIDLIQ